MKIAKIGHFTKKNDFSRWILFFSKIEIFQIEFQTICLFPKGKFCTRNKYQIVSAFQKYKNFHYRWSGSRIILEKGLCDALECTRLTKG